MKRNAVAGVFKQLAKKGMTRAYIETEDGEFIYPPISRTRPLLSRWPILLALGVIILAAGLIAFRLLTAPGSDGSVRDGLGSAAGKQTPLPLIVGESGLTALHQAVIDGNPDRTRQLLQQYPAAVNIADDYGWTPLHWAAFINNETLCRLLSEQGADRRARSLRSWFKFPSGSTALQIAEINGNSNVRHWLEEKIKKNKNNY